jgi:hypothetical protein
MTLVRQSSVFEDLIDPAAPIAKLGTGFTFTEGPIWHPVDHYLLFSDMPGDVRRRWDATRGVFEVRRPSNKCNGMTYDADLNLIVCEHATSTLVRERPDGRRETLASHYDRQELNSPNDVCVRSDGSIYFTDHGTGGCRVLASSGRANSAFKGSIGFHRQVAARNFWSTAICSISRIDCAFRPTKRSFTSTTRPRRRSASSPSPKTARCPKAERWLPTYVRNRKPAYPTA